MLTGMHKEDYEAYAPIMTKQVNREITARKKWMAASHVIIDCAPLVQKALLDDLRLLFPDAYGYAQENERMIPYGLKNVFAELEDN